MGHMECCLKVHHARSGGSDYASSRGAKAGRQKRGYFMAQRYVVPSIYQDISDQSQGYFAFRFTCQECYWSVDTMPIRSSVSTATNIMDIGVGMLGGFWGRAAEAGEQIYGSKWHTEQADAANQHNASQEHRQSDPPAQRRQEREQACERFHSSLSFC